jgi:hypothetical protein
LPVVVEEAVKELDLQEVEEDQVVLMLELEMVDQHQLYQALIEMQDNQLEEEVVVLTMLPPQTLLVLVDLEL